jgi:hypothetical protein
MVTLDDALEDEAGWEDISPEEREQAHAVVVTAYDQAGALIGRCLDDGLKPMRDAFVLPDFDKVRRQIERMRGRPPAEWTAWMEVRVAGSRNRRPAGWISVSLEPDENTPQEGKRALSTYFTLNIADEQRRRRTMQDLAKRVGQDVAKFHDYEDGPWIYRDVVLAEQMSFTEIAAAVRDFTAKAVVAQRTKIEAAQRTI